MLRHGNALDDLHAANLKEKMKLQKPCIKSWGLYVLVDVVCFFSNVLLLPKYVHSFSSSFHAFVLMAVSSYHSLCGRLVQP